MQRILVKQSPMRMANIARSLGAQSMSSAAESYTDRQAKLGRPVSPHVTIYRFPVAAITSIMNRATGVALSVGITGVGALALVGTDIPALASMLGSITVVGPVAKFAVGFPLIYHYLGAVRHTIWDRIPESTLTTEEVTKSSYILLGSSLACSAVVTLISF